MSGCLWFNKKKKKAILHFIADLNKKGASVVAQGKPAIVLLLKMQMGGAANLTDRADRWFETAKRKAAKKRSPTRKAGEVSLNKLTSMVDKNVTQFKNNIG
jgi:hypothetical protein